MDFKGKIKVLKLLEKHFDEKDEPEDNEFISKENRKFLTDSTGIMGIEPKTKEFEELLSLFFDFDGSLPTPKVDYKGSDGIEIVSSYPVDYLKFINELLFVFDSHVKTSINTNVPIRFETKDVIIYLAPKIE